VIRRGFTLLELVLALAIIAITLLVAPLATRHLDDSSSWHKRVTLERRRAIRLGVQSIDLADSLGRFRIRPDGSILTDSAPHYRLGGLVAP